MEWIPMYIRERAAYKAGDKIDADDYNNWLNRFVTQGDHNTDAIVELVDFVSRDDIINVQSDWIQTDVTADDFIKNKPAIKSGTGSYSIAEGFGIIASGKHSHAEGSNTTASGGASHAEGFVTEASGDGSHAEGSNTEARGEDSHAEGDGTIASGEDSHAEGGGTIASGICSHAEGNLSRASGVSSHAEGIGTSAKGEGSHVEGADTTARGEYSHAQNVGTIAAKRAQTTLGRYNVEDTDISSTYGKYAVIVGNGILSNRSNALTIDWEGNVEASGDITDGSGNKLSDMPTKTSDLTNDSNFVSDANYVHTDNNYTTSEKTKLANIEDNAEKNVQSDWNQTTITADDFIKNKPAIKSGSGDDSIAEGASTTASGDYSHAEGYGTTARGNYSHAQNENTVAGKRAQTALGRYNIEDINSGDYGKYAVMVGNGSYGERSNALTVDWEGNVEASGDIEDGSGNVLSQKADTANVPTKTSDLTNDSDFVSDANYIHTDNNYTTAEKNKLAGIEAGAEVNQEISVTQQQLSGTHIADIEIDGDVTPIYAPSGGSGGEDIFVAIYGTTSYSDVQAAITAGKLIIVKIEQSQRNYIIVSSLPFNGGLKLQVAPAIDTDDKDITVRWFEVYSSNLWETHTGSNYYQEELESGTNIKTINNQTVLGSGNIDINNVFHAYASGANKTTYAELCQAIDDKKVIIVDDLYTVIHQSYDNQRVLLVNLWDDDGPAFTVYSISASDSTWTYDDTYLQSHLVSGTNIKTINNISLLGSGNIDISGGVQSDWNQVDITADDYIKSKPTIKKGSGDYSIAEGLSTTASGYASHAEGYNVTANGDYSHAEGGGTKASGGASHAEGAFTIASGSYAHAQNFRTIASKQAQTALGSYNIEDINSGSYGKYAVIVGNGTTDNDRSNALTVDWEGNVEASGDVTDGSGNNLSDITNKQDVLVSGTNIKTINNQTILTSGDIEVPIVAEYGVTTYAELLAAIQATNGAVIVRNIPYNNEVIDVLVNWYSTANNVIEMESIATASGDLCDVDIQVTSTSAWSVTFTSRDPFMLLDFNQPLNVTIPVCTKNVANTQIPNVDISISDELGVDWSIASLAKYEVKDSGGNRVNCWPVCQFSMNGQKTLRLRMMCGGTTDKAVASVSGAILLKHR